MPEVIEANYKNAIKILQDIQKGTISLETDTDTNLPLASGDYKTNKSYRDRIFRKVMYEY